MENNVSKEEAAMMEEIAKAAEETSQAPPINDEGFESFSELDQDEQEVVKESEKEGADPKHFNIDGEFAVGLIDVAVSRVASLGFTIAKIPNHFQDFQLTAEEKKTLAPLVEEWLEYEKFTINPRYTLIGALLVVYGLKGFAVHNRYKQAKEEGREEEIKDTAQKNKGGRPKGAKDTKPRKPRNDKNQNDEDQSKKRNSKTITEQTGQTAQNTKPGA